MKGFHLEKRKDILKVMQVHGQGQNHGQRQTLEHQPDTSKGWQKKSTGNWVKRSVIWSSHIVAFFPSSPIFFIIVKYICCCLVAKSCLTLLRSYGLQPTRLLHPWDFLGKNTGVGCHFLLQGIFQTHQTHISWVSYIAGRFFTAEPPGEALTAGTVFPNKVTFTGSSN